MTKSSVHTNKSKPKSFLGVDQRMIQHRSMLQCTFPTQHVSGTTVNAWGVNDNVHITCTSMHKM